MAHYRIETTGEYDRLVQFFVVNGLEFDGDEEVDTDIVKCWKAVSAKEQNGKTLIGGCVLALRQGKYIIDGIAVDENFRKENIGREMMDTAVAEIRKRDGRELFLVARAPGFFRRRGFEAVSPDNAPLFFECAQCPQYQKTCYPEIMRLEIK